MNRRENAKHAKITKHAKNLFRAFACFVIFACFVFPPYTQSQSDSTLNLHRWGAVTIFHGLPSDKVNAIAEDSKGVLWFGTDNGLVSYDGRNVASFNGENSLGSRRIRALKLDARGNLWIGTDDGAARMVGDNAEAMVETRGRAITGFGVSVQNDVAAVTSRGEIFIYRESAGDRPQSERTKSLKLTLSRIDRQSQPILNSPNQQDETLPLTAAAFNGSGQLCIGSSGRGLLTYRGDELREASLTSPRPYFISSLYSNGEATWMGEQASPRAGGLWLFHKDTLSKIPVNTGAVTSLDGSGDKLFVGTSKQGVFLFNVGNKGQVMPTQIEHLTFENTAGGLRSDTINTVFVDREGVVWFGTDRGVCRYDRDSFIATTLNEHPQSNYVRTLLKASTGEIYSGTNRGLFRLTAAANDADSWPASEVGEIESRAVYAMYEDDQGSVWAGTSGGLFVKPRGSTLFTRVPHTNEPDLSETPDLSENRAENPAENPNAPAGQENPKTESQNPALKESVRAIAAMHGRIYAAVFEKGIEKIEPADLRSGYQRSLALTDKAAQHAVCFHAEDDKALWFGTIDGELRRYDGSQTTSFVLPLKTGAAVRAIETSGNKMWIGTSAGLFVRENDQIREVVPNVDVQAILPTLDRFHSGLVWIATRDAGLIKMAPDEKLSIRFDMEEGLASQQVFALATDTPRIWIGTSRGIVRHMPNLVEPQIQVKRLVADQIYLPEYLDAEVSVPHTQQNFLLEVNGISSRTYPSQFQYEFVLSHKLGKELRRIQTQDPQFAVEGLTPGPYLITARSISRDLVYSAPLTLRIRIRRAPFPWTTLFLASMLGIALIAAAWAFRQQRRLAVANNTLEDTNAELHETRLRLANETESERRRIARDLHDQTLADLRHLLVITDQLPMPSQAPTQDTQQDQPTPAIIRREIEDISKEIRQICEDLSPSVLENIGFLPALEWALSDAIAHLPADEKPSHSFICDLDLEERLQLSQIEQIQLYRIVQEALNNSCTHAKARDLTLTVRVEDQSCLLIEVKDDGVGFDGVTANMTGYGIANIRSRADLIGAEVFWLSANPGCRFQVKLLGVVKSTEERETREA